jgi:hypothetical protein
MLKKTFMKEHMTGHCGNRMKCALVYDLERFTGQLVHFYFSYQRTRSGAVNTVLLFSSHT